MASSQFKYNYRTLGNSKSEIRLLQIKPRQSRLEAEGPPELIKCTLEHISLDSKPIYHALSYTWSTYGMDTLQKSSSEIETPKIILNGQEVSVRRNLFMVLKQFREFLSFPAHPYFEAFPVGTQLWVDAISINQEDAREKSHQVRNMRQIYQNAEAVNVWLGPELHGSDLGMGIAADLSDRVRARGHTKVKEEWINPLMRAKLEDPGNYDSWASLSNIFRRPYWQRVWIVQELMTNIRTYAHVGSKVTNLTPLLASASTMQEADALAPGLLEKSSFVDVRVIVADRWSFMDPGYEGHHLLDVLCNYRHHLCSDPKDKVYGFTSMARKYNGKELVIDYELSASTVFQNTAKFIIDGTKRLDVICAAEQSDCHCKAGRHANIQIPSWVPNWSCVPVVWDRMKFEIQIPSKASLNSDAIVDFSPDGKLLTCRGLMIGFVDQIYLLPHEELSWSETLGDFHCLLTFVCDALSPDASATEQQEEASATMLEASKTLWAIYFHYLSLDDLMSTALTRDNFKLLCSDILSRPHDQALFAEHGNTIRKIINVLGKRGIFSTRLATTVPPTSHDMSSALGACPPCACEGDLVVILYGCKTPVLLRRDGDNLCRMVCAASLIDYMFGEAMGKFDERNFVIH